MEILIAIQLRESKKTEGEKRFGRGRVRGQVGEMNTSNKKIALAAAYSPTPLPGQYHPRS
jgi:hypothetical protein